MALAERGALLERALHDALHRQVHVGARSSRRPARSAPSTPSGARDLGQAFNPPVEDGLAIMADRFLEAGFSEEEVRTMAVENTRRLAGA